MRSLKIGLVWLATLATVSARANPMEKIFDRSLILYCSHEWGILLNPSLNQHAVFTNGCQKDELMARGFTVWVPAVIDREGRLCTPESGELWDARVGKSHPYRNGCEKDEILKQGLTPRRIN